MDIWNYSKTLLNTKDFSQILDLFSVDIELTDPPVGVSEWMCPESPARRKDVKTDRPPFHFQNEAFKDPVFRGRLLLSFANHELLAVELMALAILKFHDAPRPFLRGILETMKDEQRHFQLYLNRAKDLGMHWDDEAPSWFFWDALHEMKTPLEYVTAMALTLEQANLDFAKNYAEKFKAAGDLESASILDQVYNDEIAHVRFGYHWFQKWVGNGDVFEEHRKNLTPPLTLARAKGAGFDESVRSQVGFPKDYIDRLKAWGGSKGRPPVLWYYNPGVEFECANPAHRLNTKQQRVVNDLEHVLLWLAGPQDQVRVSRLPSTEFISELNRFGVVLPEFARLDDPVLAYKIAGVSPWGWSRVFASSVSELKSKIVPTSAAPVWLSESVIDQLSRWHSKAFQQKEFSPKDLSTGKALSAILNNHSEYESFIQSAEFPLMLKASIGISGSQVRKVQSLEEALSSAALTFVNRSFEQGSVVLVEPYFERLMDYSVQAEVHSDRVKILGLREFWVGRNHEYKGTYLDPKVSRHSGPVTACLRRHQPEIESFMRRVGDRLRQDGYCGPFGIDGFIYRDSGSDTAPKIRLFSELNLRHTFGRVALAVEKKLVHFQPQRIELIRREDYVQLRETGVKTLPLTDWIQAEKWVLVALA